MAYELRAAGEGGTFGLAVPPDVNATILETAAEQAQLSGLVRIVTAIFSDTWQGIAGAAPSFSFQAEAAAVADDTPTFAQAGPISVYTAWSYIPALRELEQDFGSDGLLAELTTAFGRGLADTMANKLAQGSGGGEPEGIFTAMLGDDHEPGACDGNNGRQRRLSRHQEGVGGCADSIQAERDLGHARGHPQQGPQREQRRLAGRRGDRSPGNDHHGPTRHHFRLRTRFHGHDLGI